MKLRRSLRATMCYLWRKHSHEFAQYPWKLFALADARQSAAAKASIQHDWAQRSACCLPEGFTRRLKDADIDIMDERFGHFMYWFAYLARLTVADIEVRHARNSSNAGGGREDFSNVVAQYLAQEYASLMRAGVLSTTELAGQRVGQLAIEGGGEPAQRAAKQRRRGKTALQCFMPDMDSSIKDRHGGKYTKAFWEDVRAAFGALSLERQQAYEAQSRVSVSSARRDREAGAARAVAPLDPLLAPPPLPALGDAADARPAMGMMLAPLTLNLVRESIPRLPEGTVATAEFAERCLACYRDSEAQSVELRRAYLGTSNDAVVKSLVSESQLETFIAEMPVKSRARSFADETRRIGRDPASGDRFPERVTYPTKCLCVCKSHDPGSRTLAVLALLSHTAAWCKGPRKVPSSDMLLAIESTCAGSRHVLFWWMLCASYRSAHHRPLQTFWKCLPRGGLVVGRNYKDVVLDVVRENGVARAAEPRSPFGRQAAPPSFFDEEQVAVQTIFGGEDYFSAAAQVCMWPTAFEAVLSLTVFQGTTCSLSFSHGSYSRWRPHSWRFAHGPPLPHLFLPHTSSRHLLPSSLENGQRTPSRAACPSFCTGCGGAKVVFR